MVDRNPLYDFGDEGEGEAPTFNERWGSLPVETPRFNLTPNVALVESTPNPLKQRTDPVTGRPDLKFVPVDDPWANTPKPIKRLLGVGGEERYQLWPERALRSGLSAPLDALIGKMQVNDPETGMPTDEAIRRSQDVASVGGPGGLMNLEEKGVLGSHGGNLVQPEGINRVRPAIRNSETGELLTGSRKETHEDILARQYEKETGEYSDPNDRSSVKRLYDWEKSKNFEDGFYDFKDQKFHNRNDPSSPYYGIDSTSLNPRKAMRSDQIFSDTSKPGMAMAAINSQRAAPFYSAVEHAVSNIKQDKMPADQWLGTLTNSKGVKPEELDWTGLKDHLSSKGKEPVTKQEIQDYVNANKVELKEVNKLDNRTKSKNDLVQENMNRGYTRQEAEETADRQLNEGFMSSMYPTKETKYSQYQLPGGENYKEMLMTLPNKETEARRNNGIFRTDDKASEYTSSHWDEPNVLAHVRTNDRNITAPGETIPKKSLHIEEIQSDWHQAGRDKGYRDEDNAAKIKELTDKQYEIINNRDDPKDIPENEMQQIQKLGQQAFELGANRVPDAPFKKTWHELALKRMIREAAEKGYDRLSWTPGEAQATRYSLEKQVDKIATKKNANGNYDVEIWPKGAGTSFKEEKNAKQLSDFVGKEMADKIIQKHETIGNSGVQWEGEGLKIGGEGMKGFYDKMIPNAIEKIGKEHGVKVKNGPLNSGEGSFSLQNKHGQYAVGGATREEAEAALVKKSALNSLTNDQWKVVDNRPKVHYIDIPESLKSQALGKGFPLFSSGGHFFNPIPGNPHEQVDNSHHVPYGAGASNTPTGFPVNIDKRIPKYDDKLKLPNGQPADLHKYLTIHEIEEYKAMKAGIPYHKAHHDIATPMEKKAVESDGVSWSEYTHVMDGYLKETEEGGYENLPPRLYTKPYPHSRSLKMDHEESE